MRPMANRLLLAFSLLGGALFASPSSAEAKSRATRDAGVVRMYTELAIQWRELAATR